MKIVFNKSKKQYIYELETKIAIMETKLYAHDNFCSKNKKDS